MASRKPNLICVLFNKVPEGTRFRKGAYSWVDICQALDYIENAFGKEYDPIKKKIQDRNPVLKSDLPENLPGRNYFIIAGKDFSWVQKMNAKGKLKSIPGIGKSTEHKINKFLEDK